MPVLFYLNVLEYSLQHVTVNIMLWKEEITHYRGIETGNLVSCCGVKIARTWFIFTEYKDTTLPSHQNNLKLLLQSKLVCPLFQIKTCPIQSVNSCCFNQNIRPYVHHSGNSYYWNTALITCEVKIQQSIKQSIIKFN